MKRNVLDYSRDKLFCKCKIKFHRQQQQQRQEKREKFIIVSSLIKFKRGAKHVNSERQEDEPASCQE
jgi:hypothetical protein